MVLLLKHRVRDDELSVIEHEVRDEVAAEGRDLIAELCCFPRELRERLLDPLFDEVARPWAGAPR